MLFDCDNHSTPVTTMSLLGLFSFSFRNPVSAFRNFLVVRDSVEPSCPLILASAARIHAPPSAVCPPASDQRGPRSIIDVERVLSIAGSKLALGCFRVVDSVVVVVVLSVVQPASANKPAHATQAIDFFIFIALFRNPALLQLF